MYPSKRQEPFRYSFEPALPCLLRLYEINRNRLESKQGKAELLDLSPNGCKLDTKLNFRAGQNECKIALTFELVQPLELKGKIKWQEQKAHGFLYGIQFEGHNPQTITEMLKLYAKQSQKQAAASIQGSFVST